MSENTPAVSGRKAFLRILSRALLILLVTLLLLAAALYAAIAILIKGPSERAEYLFVRSVHETSALKFIPSLVMSREAEDAVLYAVPEPEPEPKRLEELAFAPGAVENELPEMQAELPPPEQPEIEIIDLKGATYKGKLMLVKDPSRVVVGTLTHYGSGVGEYLTEFIERYHAVGGTNAGGFMDINGNGTGAEPDGLVIENGKITWGGPGMRYVDVIGFDADHRLHVGDLTGQEALDLGIVSAVSFSQGPVLIQDGKKLPGLGGGMNPRTCIGQRADGTVLLAVIEGRHPDSFGATYDDLADLMSEYGAVNAGNLDGGSSSAMMYEGEQLTKGSNLIGSRRMATAILILPE